jgi:hypothetical protein
MANFLAFFFLIFILMQSKKNIIFYKEHLESRQLTSSVLKVDRDSLFVLKKKGKEDVYQIFPPENSNFSLPDSNITIQVFKYGDFNADGKEDIIIDLGACGTGACVFGLFLKQYENHYSLALMDYLKNVEFEISENGLWSIFSSEEFEAYNPSKLFVRVYKYDKKSYLYHLDSTYIHYDKESEMMINELKKSYEK